VYFSPTLSDMFAHLRLHSEYSIIDGALRIDQVVNKAKADQQPALALTDLNNIFGAIKFYKECRSAGLKPIIGADIFIQLDPFKPDLNSRVLLLVQNNQGYLNLCQLLSLGWTQNVHRTQALIKVEWLKLYNEGLICLSGAHTGPLGQALLSSDQSLASQIAIDLAGIFPHRFYIEIQRSGRADDERLVHASVLLASKLQLPLVATHPIQFLEPNDFEAHEARVCIADGEILGNARRVRKFTAQQHFRSAAQMKEIFADLPSALSNAIEIAVRCNLSIALGRPQLPNYPTPLVNDQAIPIEEYFRAQSHQGLQERLSRLYPDQDQRNQQTKRYVERLDFEIHTILKMGFPGYFLIVSDFINWAKNNGCPVGPGRGSGAGSLVAYALKITDLDPLQYNLLFERFLNPERVSMPDFDIDFCQANRDRVIEYVKQKYGREAVSQIVTFGTMAARAAIRDVGRVLDLNYSFCDGIAKLIPNKPGVHMTLEKALAAEPLLAERVLREEETKILFSLAQNLEGLTRNVGMHAGGVLIAPGKLTDFCPLYQQPGSDSAVSQFDKDDVEAAGLVKFDFLGLATLTILERAKDLIQSRHAGLENFSFEDIPLDDAATYQLFSDGKTEAVFQFESRGMQGMLKDAKPTRLEDLIALNALYRPGPMDLIPSFVARKHGREEVVYPHPLVEPVLSETYGIMVYQEQVMQTAQVLGGYTLGGADLLRRAMGKKKPEEMALHRKIFREGAIKNHISEQSADEIFDLMERFAGYGFNKSHAAAYSLLAYQTAWIKVHYSAEFFCANMTVEMDNTDKLRVLFEDAKRFGLVFESPNVNRGQYFFWPVSNSVICYGLGAVKGTGQQAVEAIVSERNSNGEFKSLFDFCKRIDRSKVNKRSVEALIKAGAFDCLSRDRSTLCATLERAFEYAAALESSANQGGLFDLHDGGVGSMLEEPDHLVQNPWGVREQLGFEKSALGFYLSGHLFDEVQSEVRRFVKKPLKDIMESREPQLLAGMVSDFRVINAQRGKLALFKLDDKTANLEASVDEALMNAYKNILREDELIIVMARVQVDRFSGAGALRINVQQIWDLAGARCRFGKYLRLMVNSHDPDIRSLMKEFPPKRESTEHGETIRGLGVRMQLIRGDIQAEIELGEAIRFYPTNQAIAAWSTQAYLGNAQVIYD
jgi:DNA polymerase III subunit alpha